MSQCPCQAEVDAALAQRDGLIAELQEAVIELSHALADRAPPPADMPPADITNDVPAPPATLEQRIAAAEARLAEQEHTLRHMLTMLIDWIEDGDRRRHAA